MQGIRGDNDNLFFFLLIGKEYSQHKIAKVLGISQ